GAGKSTDTSLMTSGAAMRAAFQFQQARREQQRENGQAGPKGAGPKAPGKGAVQQPAAPPSAGAGVAPQQIYVDEAKARFGAALAADIGFAERLAWFWSNHFCVSADKAGVRPPAGGYEREADRPPEP